VFRVRGWPNPNDDLIQRFYAAFDRKDGRRWWLKQALGRDATSKQARKQDDLAAGARAGS